ncbi:ABC transporter ATP-binding protein [Streptomyces sp. NPDC003077]|uniref:ABC transporter ATP-binding protein n=1 Tax=Streptomyces sp. NPDC003077 TaxID=3154443 RepID=UPI0033B7ED37
MTARSESMVVTPPFVDKNQPAALELAGLHKEFGTYTAVESAHLSVAPGSFYGLVGPNGAGKTTTLSMAVGLLRPDGGRARVFGVDVWEEPERAKALMGVLPDGLALPEQLTGRELLTYLGRLRGLDRATVAARVEELLTVLELTGDVERTLVIDYSTGMRKKIGLATALLHGPRLLVLDEPFEAVDPVSAATIKRILRRFVASGGSVLLSSHVMALVEQLCDTVAVMAKGRVVVEGPVDRVRGGKTLEETFVELVGHDAGGGEGLSWLSH